MTMNFPAPDVHRAEAEERWLSTRDLGLRDGLARPGQCSGAGHSAPGRVSRTARQVLGPRKPQFLHLENGDGTTFAAGRWGLESSDKGGDASSIYHGLQLQTMSPRKEFLVKLRE